MRRFIGIALALMMVTAACGGGDDGDGGTTTVDAGSTAASTGGDDPTPTTSATPPAASGFSGSGNFCEDADNSDNLADGIDLLAVDIEASVNDWLAVLDEIEGAAPSEIAADVAVIVNASRQFAEMLAEADYQMLNIDPDDPRMAAFDGGSFEEAVDNIEEFCGWDLDAGFGGGDDPGIGGNDGSVVVGNDDIPDNIPAALIPPNVESVDDNGAAGLSIASSASFEDVVAYYENLLGSPISTDGDTVTFNGTVDGSAAVVLVQPVTGGFVLVTLIVF